MMFQRRVQGEIRALGAIDWRATMRVAWGGMRADRAAYMLIAIYVAAGFIWLVHAGQWRPEQAVMTGQLYALLWTWQYGVLFPVILAICGIAHIIHRIDGRRRLAFRTMAARERLGGFLAGTLLVAALLPFQLMFNMLKNTIAMTGFAYDRPLADLDRLLHFGVDPFALLYGLGKHEWLLRLVELNYNSLWFFICFGTLYWVVTSPRLGDALRQRYVVTYLLLWALAGTVFAILLRSAGPVYYAAVTGDSARFAEVTAYLATTSGQPGAAADFQAYLWSIHAAGTSGLGSGISAFPSMHVAIITLNVLLLGELKRRWLPLGVAYLIVVQMSSVYLGWHYAVDGYASMAMTAAIWWAVKRAASVRWVWRRAKAGATEGAVA